MSGKLSWNHPPPIWNDFEWFWGSKNRLNLKIEIPTPSNKNGRPFLFEGVGISILRFNRFLDPQNHSKSFQIGGGWFQDSFPDIFYFYEKFDFFTILARLAQQNVPVGPKMAQNGHFRPFLGNFLIIFDPQNHSESLQTVLDGFWG